MTEATPDGMAPGPVDAPPPGTAIVRPLRHVRTVRERYLRRFPDPAAVAASRSARAWSWALGETATAPVTDRQTPTPPTRSDIEAEIAEADHRRIQGGRQNRADAAATILRWLIGHDNHVPVQTKNPGKLVGGFGNIVRSPTLITSVMALAVEHQRIAPMRLDVPADQADWRPVRQDPDYLNGVIATLAWVLGERQEAPISRVPSGDLSTSDLKKERLHAEDIIEHIGSPQVTRRPLSTRYGEGVRGSISWLLGDSIASPLHDGRRDAD